MKVKTNLKAGAFQLEEDAFEPLELGSADSLEIFLHQTTQPLSDNPWRTSTIKEPFQSS